MNEKETKLMFSKDSDEWTTPKALFRYVEDEIIHRSLR